MRSLIVLRLNSKRVRQIEIRVPGLVFIVTRFHGPPSAESLQRSERSASTENGVNTTSLPYI